jgi:hypothetical protein
LSTGRVVGTGLFIAVVAGVILLFIEYDGFKGANQIAYVTVTDLAPSQRVTHASETSSLAAGAAGAPNVTPKSPASDVASQVKAFAPVAVSLGDAVFTASCEIENWSGYWWENAAPSIGGTPHPGGFTCRVIYNSASGHVDFLVPAGATRFTVAAGQLDSAPNLTLTMRFSLINTVSGEVLASSDLGYGQAADFDVPVSGVLRLTLNVNMLSHVTSTQDLAGIAAWGDPTFR